MTTHDHARFDDDLYEDCDDCDDCDADDEVEPDINDHRFRTPDDVRDWARRDFLMSCKAYNEIWLLDADGAYIGCCTSRSVVRLGDLAGDPSILLRATELALAEVPHARWLVFENREGSEGDPRPTERDAQALVALRDAVGPSASVVDALILGEHGQLWSLHEVLAPGQPYLLSAH